MKSTQWIGGVVVVGLVAGGWWWWSRSSQLPANQVVQPVEVREQTGMIPVVLDFGDEVATYSAAWNEGATVLTTLLTVSEMNDVEVEVQEYDFGSLVGGIEGRVNTAERAWIYFVNGQAGDVGADQKQITEGDIVEWKYIEPIY